MDINFDNLDAILPIPNRGVAWRKFWALVSLAGLGAGTTIGTTTWTGIEHKNNSITVVELKEKIAETKKKKNFITD